MMDGVGETSRRSSLGAAMHWVELPETLDALVAKTAAPTWDIKRAVASIFTIRPAGYFYCPATEKVAAHGDLTLAEFSGCKSALARAVGKDSVRQELLDDRRAACGEWVKVAYSPAMRGVGEALNFFPGTYPGGIPNHPSPVAAMLASALVGGGLGYGAGWLGEKVLPKGYGTKLKRTGAVLGALAGAAPGALWALANHRTGHSITDPWPMDESKVPTDSLLADKPDKFSTHQLGHEPPELKVEERGMFTPREKWFVPPDPKQYYRDLKSVKLGHAYLSAVESFLKRADFGDYGGGFAPASSPTPYDVNINHLGQTLWQYGASTPLLGATMGTMYAAQRLPDPNAQADTVTGNQLGQLALNAGRDYLTGLALGALVNTAVGTPFSAPAFGVGNAVLGMVRAGVKSLFS